MDARARGQVLLLLVSAFAMSLTMAGPAPAEDAMLPFKLKPLYLDTVLASKGRPNAVIVTADDVQYQSLAKAVRKAIAEATGAELEIRRGSELANNFGELKAGAPKQNLILVAGPSNNNLVTCLIHSSYCALETDYPGKGGSIFRTIHDPWGNGAHAILLGGSNFVGAQQAADRFLATLKKSDTLVVPRTMDIVLPTPATEPTDDEIKAELKKQKVNFEQGQQGGLFTPICRAGSTYSRTGKEGYAKLFRDLMYLEDELRRGGGEAWDSPWGGAADFLFSQLIDAWDAVEESPSLTDSDRERITRIILDYIHYYEGYGTIKGMERQVLRNNHNTFTNIGFLKAGIYFDKYYHLPEAKQWISNSELCFLPETKAFKSQEDCSGYGWINMRHVCNYCLTRPDFTWFTSGKADLAGDLYIMATDNLGHQATYGDVGGWTGNGQTAMWYTLTDVERSGRYAWAIRKVGGSSEPGTAVHGVEPTEPSDLLGVKRRVTEPMYYDLYNGKGTVPQERTFDKISMRSSFDADKPYLLLDGINGGYHGHWDANSILRYTDKGRIWLADCDYIKSLPRYHNSMLVLRDGQSGKMPTFAECELAADLGLTGFTSTTIHDYAGTDWRRNILWDKNGAFVFIDEVTTQAPSQDSPEKGGSSAVDDPIEISARCIWHTLGVPKLKGNLFQVTQKGPTFSILNLDGARQRFSDDRELGANWTGYEYADPVVHSLQQVQTRQLKAGERICFTNVLSTSSGKSVLKAERAGESSALVGSGKDRALVGARSGDGDIVPGLMTDATAYWISSSRIALGHVTSVRLEGSPVLSSRDPISIEILPGGMATFVADTATQLRIAANPMQLKLDGKGLSSSPDNGMTMVDVPTGKHVLAGLTVPSTFSFAMPQPAAPDTQAQTITTGAKALVEAAKPETGAKILSLAADANGAYVGRADGKLERVFGEKKWTVAAGDAVTAVWTGKLAKNDPNRVALGTSKGKIVLLDEIGGKLWDRQLPFYKVDPLVDYFTSADLAGDGNRSLVIGSDNWQHFAYDATGKQLWSFMSIRGSTAGTAVDLDGDGKQEPVIGTEYNQVHALNPDGTSRWRLAKIGGPKINAVVSCVLAQTGKPGAIFGGAEGTVYAYDADGKQVWKHDAGDEITCMQVADLNGDGVTEILVGSRSFSLSAIDTGGNRIWRFDAGEPILSMAVGDLNADGKQEVCIGTEDGHVMVVDHKGSILADWSANGPVRKLATLPGSPTRLAVACDDGRLVLLRM